MPRKSARQIAKIEQAKEKQIYFDELLEKFIESVATQVQELKTHQVGAHTYGADGLFIIALEALTAAQRNRDPGGYVTAAAYTLAAVMHAVGAWDNPNKPQVIDEEKEVA